MSPNTAAWAERTQQTGEGEEERRRRHWRVGQTGLAEGAATWAAAPQATWPADLAPRPGHARRRGLHPPAHLVDLRLQVRLPYLPAVGVEGRQVSARVARHQLQLAIVVHVSHRHLGLRRE